MRIYLAATLLMAALVVDPVAVCAAPPFAGGPGVTFVAVEAALVFGDPVTRIAYESAEDAVAAITQREEKSSHGTRLYGVAYVCPQAIAGTAVSQYGELWGRAMSYCADLTDSVFPNNDGPMVVVSGNPRCPYDLSRTWKYDVVSHEKRNGVMQLRVQCVAAIEPGHAAPASVQQSGRLCRRSQLWLAPGQVVEHCFFVIEPPMPSSGARATH